MSSPQENKFEDFRAKRDELATKLSSEPSFMDSAQKLMKFALDTEQSVIDLQIFLAQGVRAIAEARTGGEIKRPDLADAVISTAKWWSLRTQELELNWTAKDLKRFFNLTMETLGFTKMIEAAEAFKAAGCTAGVIQIKGGKANIPGIGEVDLNDPPKNKDEGDSFHNRLFKN